MFDPKPPLAPLTLVLALGLDAAGAGPVPQPQTISLERDCNGCPTGSRLVLHADGRAQLATLGKARLGTEDALREGRLSIDEFAALAQLAQARGFFDLDDEIVDAQLQDGRWLLLRIEGADGQARQVFNRGAAPPPALADLLDAIDAAGSRIVFAPPD